jgi:hypothetical protein
VRSLPRLRGGGIVIAGKIGQILRTRCLFSSRWNSSDGTSAGLHVRRMRWSANDSGENRPVFACRGARRAT